jgi:hypothetical protein
MWPCGNTPCATDAPTSPHSQVVVVDDVVDVDVVVIIVVLIFDRIIVSESLSQ